MRAAAVLIAAGVVFTLPVLAQARMAFQPNKAQTCDTSAKNRERLARACGVDQVDLVVCINDFIYQPPIITPRQGDTVAWVNIEKCADPAGGPINVVESLVAEDVGIGCDTHHEVVTLPDESSIIGNDSLDARICSPYPGIEPKSGIPAIPGFEINAGACGGFDPEEEANDTNVFCHTFENVGLQHYTCMTNPVHTVLLNGGILVLPKEAPALPELPQSPQL